MQSASSSSAEYCMRIAIACGTADGRRMAFVAGAVSDLTFLSLHSLLGAGAFLVFAIIAAAGGMYVYRVLPETRGVALAEVQHLLNPESTGIPSPALLASHLWSCARLRHCVVTEMRPDEWSRFKLQDTACSAWRAPVFLPTLKKGRMPRRAFCEKQAGCGGSLK